jgi:hypothetical protein
MLKVLKNNKIKRILTTLFIVVIMSLFIPVVPVGAVDAWYDLDWSYRIKITFSNASSEALSNFPVLVRLTSSNFTFAHAKSAGADIRFTDSDGSTLLKYEIEKWTDNTEGDIWVKVPQVDNSATDYIYIYYGNSGASDAQDIANVWNSDYVTVQHMADTTTSTITDSTSYNNDGTKIGANAPAVTTSGKIGNAQNFDGSNDAINIGTDSSLDLGETFTVEAYVKPLTGLKTYAGVIGKTNSTRTSGTPAHMEVVHNNSYIGAAYNGNWVWSSNAGIAINNWYYLQYKVTGDNIYYWVNGTAYSSAGFPYTDDSSMYTFIGSWYSPATTYDFLGIIDEVRISKIARSDNWLKASNKAVSDTLCSYSGEEYGASPPIVTTQAVSAIKDTTATGNGNITSEGSEDVTTRGICYSDSNNPPTTADSKVYEEGSFSTGAYTESLTGLDTGVLYYVRAYAISDEGTGYGSVVTFTTYVPSITSNSMGLIVMGRMAPNDVYTTGLDVFSTTNNGNCAIDITISATDMTGGNTWTLSDSCTPAPNTYGLKAGLDGADYTIIVKKEPPFNTLTSNLAIGSSISFGLKFYMPTSMDDAAVKKGTATLNIVMH